MNLKQIRIKPFSKNFRHIRRLLLTQFPKEELYPIWLLRLATRRKDYDCTAFFDGDTFVGFYYLLLAEKTLFLLYTAVDPDLQSKGYGSAVQKAIRKNYPEHEITCHIEAPKDIHSETEQAARRLRFYERTGFSFTGYRTVDDGVTYWVLSSKGKNFDRAAYEKLFYDKEGEKGVPKLEPAE